MCLWYSSVKVSHKLSFNNSFVTIILKKNSSVKSTLTLLINSGFISLSNGCNIQLMQSFMLKNNMVSSLIPLFSLFEKEMSLELLLVIKYLSSILSAKYIARTHACRLNSFGEEIGNRLFLQKIVNNFSTFLEIAAFMRSKCFLANGFCQAQVQVQVG